MWVVEWDDIANKKDVRAIGLVNAARPQRDDSYGERKDSSTAPHQLSFNTR